MERFLVLFLVAVAFPHAPSDPTRALDLAIPDSIQQDLDAGRFWKASIGLRAHFEPVANASVSDRLILAEAEAGWKNWPGVIEALEAGSPDPAGGPARYWFLLGTARHRMGDVEAGVKDLEEFLAVARPGSPSILVAESRLLQAADMDSVDVVVRSLVDLRASSPVLSDWTALELARALSTDGRPRETARILDLIVDPAAAGLAWSWVSDAWAVLGDSVSALQALEPATGSDGAGPAPADLLDKVWRLRLATGDTAGSYVAAAELLVHGVAGAKARAAASHVLAGADSLGNDHLLRAADALSRSGENRQALRAWTAAEAKGAELSDAQRLTKARVLGALGDRLAANREYQALSATDVPEIAAPALNALARARRREGKTGAARELEDSLVTRFPTRNEALNLVYLRGDGQQDAGRVAEAIEHYKQVITMSSSANRAGLARMRWGHIHLTRSEYALAAEVFEGYLAEFPTGRRWEEASYWGAWAARQMEDDPRAGRLIDKLNLDNPLSYYAVMATQLGPYELALDFPDGAALPRPEWLSEELEVLALLEAADLTEGTASHVKALKAAAWDSEDVLMRLAVELNARGRTMDGINLGWELRRRGRPWDKRLLRIIYPFPYREMVMSFAEERELDPYLLAGLIRQESAFVPDIVSRAGAVGLMQVIPSTGRQVARSVGPKDFRSESLTTPEVNVHLGTRFLADLLRRYDDLPLVLSAYNAGPTRADRWKKFPEAGDAGRFTERIPFAETRGYVKNVTRNRALYRYLYEDMELSSDDR